jgi:hypothetical protein
MDQGGKPGLAAQLAASLDWWRDAGVDALFHDAPVNWIKPPEEKPEPTDHLRPRAGGDLGEAESNRAAERGPRLPGGQFTLSGRPAGQPKGPPPLPPGEDW